MDDTDINAVARSFAAERDLIVWEAFPWDGAIVVWPDLEDLSGYLDIVERVGAQILYLEDDGVVLGFAANGVVHAFPSAKMGPHLLGGSPVHSPVVTYNGTDDFGLTESEPDYESPYFDHRSRRVVDGDLRDLIDKIVADPRYDGYESRSLLAEYTAHLDVDDAETVGSVARRLFSETVGNELDHRAQQLVASLAADPAFDPLAWGEDLRDFLGAGAADEDPRVVHRLQRELPSYARERGLVRQAEREVAESARRILGAMPEMVRDQFGFASKNATRSQIADPYLDDLPDNRREHVLRKLVDLESDLHSAKREARYATAVRRLLDRDNTKAETSRRLGISTTVMDRIVRSYRADLELDSEDPILTTLAPEIT